ncbi:MAG: type IV pilus assembly protein PilM [Planctomycetales bacterium]
MADSSAVWGIDIGQAGLKALRLRYAAASDQVMAIAFDYIPHAKILSQPDAIPGELIGEALKMFFSRNETKNDRIAISISSQSALTRFIHLPPVQTNKIAEIIKYEARQQIPFPLEEVIWDYQPLGAGIEEGGYLLDAEVGLFAMKRDQIMQSLQPFTDAKCEVELVQLSPLALYNFLAYDQLNVRPEVPPANPEEYTILLDMGADNTTFLVSNGLKIWIRNIQIGGNHFTRALTKEMKLTFAKAEHLKCNATKAPDPKAVFQALRPVFNEFVTEIQRSIGYYSSTNRDAKIQKIVGVGNGFKLAGLQKFLQQSLQYPVERVETFPGLQGTAVLDSPLFQENSMAFAVPYGLALQVLGQTRVKTSLLPPEIRTARMIRKKKPWAVVGAAAILVGLVTSATGQSLVNNTVSDTRWGAAKTAADAIASSVNKEKAAYEAAKGALQAQQGNGRQLVMSAEGRDNWTELFKAIDMCIPHPETPQQQAETDITKKRRMKIYAVTSKPVSEFGGWFGKLQPQQKNDMLEPDKTAAPAGAGYIVTLRGIHYVKTDTGDFVNKTLIEKLNQFELPFETASGVQEMVPIRKLGISHPVVISQKTVDRMYDPYGTGGSATGGNVVAAVSAPLDPKAAAEALRKAKEAASNPQAPAAEISPMQARRITEYQFEVQFAWKEIPPHLRPAVNPIVPKPATPAPGTTPGATPGTPAAPGTPPVAGAKPGAPATPAAPAAAPAAVATPAKAATPRRHRQLLLLRSNFRETTRETELRPIRLHQKPVIRSIAGWR